ncbi:Glycosyl transferase family 2 [Cohnella sp. OV330]|uniref:glycosyltransferase family 2 protein n=1 Tax=Cohnella sp. OV330 TaxID=1855288 RepID=UPI0008E47517|nr:glycosyltransferase [Cohnella sp. OV330]SFA93500.1 Glycosyl transferase family 2 [Cohnella sp. OV330]
MNSAGEGKGGSSGGGGQGAGRPKVTAVIPFFNDPYIGEAVESVLAQRIDGLEVIVVDDGSTREAWRLHRFQGRIHVLGKANGGTASALNHGFRMARGEYVAWLSSDDRWLPGKLERQVEHMERTGSSISHTAFRTIDAAGVPSSKPVRLAFESRYDFYRSLLRSNAINGCTVMMRKALFEQLGGFDEGAVFTHDYDLWVRATLAGYPPTYLNEPLTEYRKHAGMGTIRHQGEAEAEFMATAAKYRGSLVRLLTALRPPLSKAGKR